MTRSRFANKGFQRNCRRRYQAGSIRLLYLETLEPRQLLTVAAFGDSGLIYNVEYDVPVAHRMELLKEHLDLGPLDTLREIQAETDRLGFQHFKYQQLLGDVPVEGGVYSVHAKDGLIVSLSGDFIKVGAPPVTAVLADETALASATQFVGASRYRWDDPAMVSRSVHAAHANPPRGDMVYFRDEHGEVSLAYKFDVYAVEPMSRDYVFVDAQSGNVLGSFERIHAADVAATGTSLYNGTVEFIADTFSGGFRLRQATNGVQTFTLNNSTSLGNAVDITSATSSFTASNARAGVSAHWAAEQTLDYYLTHHGRDSYDGNGATLYSYVNYNVNYVNAGWTGSEMIYGDGNGTTHGPLVTLDIAGHEITHGVVEYTSGLIYSYESGALNESFADIFGEVIENYGSGTNDWLMGDQIGIGQSGALRSFANPNLFNDPDTYLGTFWQTSSGDYGGVHTNSGVQNKWFYILTVGESGTDDFGVPYNVTGIGMEDAAAIAYRNTSVYLTPSSGYRQARDGAVQAAIDLFGVESQQHISTVEAWNAVGLYDTSAKSLGALAGVASQGSLIYSSSHTDNLAVGIVGNVFSVNLDEGQTLTAAAEGMLGLIPHVTIRDPNGVTIATAIAHGATAIAQSAPVQLAGAYTITVAADGNTEGHYLLRVLLNSDAETESFGGNNNDSRENAQDIESSSLPLGGEGTTATDRLAVTGSLVSTGDVVGSQDFESGSFGAGWTTSSSSSNGRIRVTGAMGTANGSFAVLMDDRTQDNTNTRNQAIWTVNLAGVNRPILNFSHAEWYDETHVLPATFTGNSNGDGVAISVNGTNWYTVFTNSDTEAGRWFPVTVELAEVAAAYGISLNGNVQIKFQQYDNVPMDNEGAPQLDGRGYDEIRITESRASEDWYKFQVTGGVPVTLVASTPALSSPLKKS